MNPRIRNIILIPGLALEHAANPYALKRHEAFFATDTRELRLGPGTWDAANVLNVDTLCRVATTANITIATALNVGDTIDNVVLALGDRVLVKNQSTANQNGVWVVGATPVRATDFDAFDEHVGRLVGVTEGSAGAGHLYRFTGVAGGTLNTTAINWQLVQNLTINAKNYGQLATLPVTGGTTPGTTLFGCELANGIYCQISLTNIKASLALLP